MAAFQNVLVGLDLLHRSTVEATDFGPVSRRTIDQAFLLARMYRSRLVFFSALELGEEQFHLLPAHYFSQWQETASDTSQAMLDQVVREARQRGFDAESVLVHGRGWIELSRQVEQHKHDLVMIGARTLTGLRRVLFANTAMKLFRVCQCPVWVTHPGTRSANMNILIATDLKKGSEEILQAGLELGAKDGGQVHVLHVLEYPLDRVWSTGLPDLATEGYHTRIRAGADERLQQWLSKPEYAEIRARVHVHLVDGVGVPDVAIQQHLHLHHIDLLLMGTAQRRGVPGLFFGNTAERLLPEVQCSVLVFKEPHFTT